MWKRLSAAFGMVAFSLVAAFAGLADSTMEYSVQLSARVQNSPAHITLNWLQDSTTVPDTYTLYRRTRGAESWGQGITLPGSKTTFVDSNVTPGTAYEYQIIKKTPAYTGYGYIYSGINVPLTEDRGKLLLVLDNTYASDLAPELDRLETDLIGDGWTVTRL
ncbi:MAG: fibronectin type III domain-containing protein, partial [Verrucomicrobiota bacterium]